MQNNKLILLFALITAALFSNAQNEGDFTSRPTGRGEYSFVAYAGGGFGYFPSNKGTPAYLQPVKSKWNTVGTLRIMWHTDHLLKAGLETGYMTFYSYKLKDSVGRTGKIALDAIPILLEFSMSLKSRINIFAGTGVYILNTKLDYAGKVNSNKVSSGWMLAASYIYPIGKTVGLGTEVKWLYATETSNGSVCGQVQLVWRFLKW